MALREFKFVARTLLKSPVFTLTAAVTIALGVGASTAIFSVTNAVLLRPLPYENPDRLVIARSDMRNRNVRDFPFSNEEYVDLRDGTKGAFEDMAGVFTFRNIVPREDDTPEQIHVAVATTNFFRVMGAKVVYGRDFTDADGIPQPPAPAAPAGAQPNAAPAQPPLPTMAILSYEYFQRRYGGNPAAVGKTMVFNAQFSPQIVGVLAPHFQLYFPPASNEEVAPDIWLANRLDYDVKNRKDVSIRAIGRLKEGVTLEQAQAAADRVTAEARKTYLIEGTAGYAIHLEPMRDHLVAETRPAILALMGAVIFLLLIACANVTNLLLVRASLREREFAVRAALGGTWWHLARQILAEAFLLAGIGAAAGLGLAWLGIHELLAIAPANLPRLETIRIDGFAVAFTTFAGVFAGAICGLASAWRASRPDVMSVLRGSGRHESLAGGGFVRNLVVVVEVALSFVLLIGSGLMFRSFLELQRINPGFDPHGLLTFQILGNRRAGKTPEQRAAETRRMQERLGALSGVQSVTASFPFPLAGGFSPIRWGTEEALTDASKFQAVDYQIVLPGYFEMMRTPLLAGRTFTEEDNQPGRNLVLIDQMLAEKAFPHKSAVGGRILIRIRSPEAEWVEVIGVVGHQRDESLAVAGREQVYFTEAFLGGGVVQYWAMRTASDPAGYGSQVRAAIKEVDPHLMVAELEPMDTLVEKAQSGTRFSLLLIGVFAVVAALLAGVGLYGVLSTVVRQRTAEIGVRMALGAGPERIFRLIVGQGLRLTATGIAVGLLAAFGLTRMMIAMLVGVKATDPATFAAIAVLFLLIATMAAWLPARRAAGLDPNVALREE
jgi:putative ABC transport system permease protein